MLVSHFSFGGLGQKRFVSMATYPKINGELNKLRRYTNSHALVVFNKFHCSLSLNNEKDTKWISERFGSECAVVPVELDQYTKFWKIIRALFLISREFGVGYYVDIVKNNQLKVSIFGKSQEAVEQAGKALLDRKEQMKKTKEDFPKGMATVELEAPQDSRISKREQVQYALNFRREEIERMEEKFGCRIFYQNRGRQNIHVDIYCDDPQKRGEAETEMKAFVKRIAEELNMETSLAFSIPNKFQEKYNPLLLGQSARKEFGRNVTLSVVKTEDGPCFKIRAPDMKTADEFKIFLLESIEKNMAEMESYHHEMIELPLQGTMLSIPDLLPRLLRQSGIEFLQCHFIRKPESVECILYGKEPEEVQRMAEEVRLLLISLTKPKQSIE